MTLEEMQAKVGEVIGTSDWFLIDQHRIDQFADTAQPHLGAFALRALGHRLGQALDGAAAGIEGDEDFGSRHGSLGLKSPTQDGGLALY